MATLALVIGISAQVMSFRMAIGGILMKWPRPVLFDAVFLSRHNRFVVTITDALSARSVDMT